jgi:hypothetical protein
LVNLVEEWKVLEGYAGNKRGFYQILENKKAIEIRVKVGELGFKRDFENKEDQLPVDILGFCKSKNYIEISNNIMDAYFFEHIPEAKKEK